MTVLLFAKAPEPGRVKTRLAAEIGDARAVRLYRHVGAMVFRAIDRVSDVTVLYDPPDAEWEIKTWLGATHCRPQASGDLGHRLSTAFADHFAETDAPAIAVGTDAPGVDATIIAQAEHELTHRRVVLGPATDGGYYLIGLRAPAPALFGGIAWSTDGVFVETFARCRAMGIEPAVLPELRDMDTLDDAVQLGLYDLDR